MILQASFWGIRRVQSCLTTRKIKRAVPDFVCTVSMAEGIRSSVRYMMDHPESQTPDPQFDAWCDRIAGAWKAADEAFGK